MLYQKLVNIKERIEDQLNSFIKNESTLKLYFNENYPTHVSSFQDGLELLYGENDFQRLYSQSKEYLEKQLQFINLLIENKTISEDKYKLQLKRVLEEFINAIGNNLTGHGYYENLIFEYSQRPDFSQDFNSIILLSNFSWFENNVVLIGGNGSGKTNLARALKGSEREHISVIPAQKTLYYSLNDPSLYRTRIIDLEKQLLENNIDKSKSTNSYDYYHYQNNQFTKLIIGMKEEYFDYLSRCDKDRVLPSRENSVFGKLSDIFNLIFSDIKLELSSDADGYLQCQKNGEIYHVNSLSEGEKAVIFYSLNVLMAKRNSFIVVDEPETYLNVSLTNSLWSSLISIRDDCKFIFITHSVDFVLSRRDSKLLWIKKYTYPSNWEFTEIEDSFELPRLLITEILGSKKPILFCEGNDKSSLDYEIYHALFGNEYTVIPVGGHFEVIQYTKVLVKSDWINLDCIGIIDGDNLFEEEKLKKLKDFNIKVLPFNEIEMMLLSDDVMNITLSSTYHDETSQRIDAFKKEFWTLACNHKDRIIMNFLKNTIDSKINNQGIQNYDSIQSVKNDIESNLLNVVDSLHINISTKVQAILDSRKYDDLLKVCNLKKAISKGLADRFLDSEYEKKAVLKIRNTPSLKEVLLLKFL